MTSDHTNAIAGPQTGRGVRETRPNRDDFAVMPTAACGECPKGQCDGCSFCDYFVEFSAWLKAGAVGTPPALEPKPASAWGALNHGYKRTEGTP